MGDFGETSAGDVWGWDRAGGDSLVGDGPPPKRGGEYWGIGIVEVLWKVCSVLVNCLLKRSVVLHVALHGFR